MRDPAPTPVRLRDYAPCAYVVDRVELEVEISEDHALVRSRLAVARRAEAPPTPLVLDGEELELESVSIDGRVLAAGEYALDARHLLIAKAPGKFSL